MEDSAIVSRLVFKTFQHHDCWSTYTVLLGGRKENLKPDTFDVIEVEQKMLTEAEVNRRKEEIMLVKKDIVREINLLGVVVYAFNSSSQESEAEVEASRSLSWEPSCSTE